MGIINGRSSESIYEDEKDVDHHDAQNKFHGMVDREIIDPAENRLEIQVISKRTYESGIPSVKINVEYTEKEEERNRRNIGMIKKRCFDKDEENSSSKDETYHDAQSSSYGTIVKESVDSVTCNIEIRVIPAKPDESSILAAEKKNEAEVPWKLRIGTKKDPMKNQTHKKVLSVDNTNLVELIDSSQQENLESHDTNYKSLIENNVTNGLTVEGFKSGIQHLNSGYNRS